MDVSARTIETMQEERHKRDFLALDCESFQLAGNLKMQLSRVEKMAKASMGDDELPIIASFAVRRRGYLAADGAVIRRLPSFASDTDLLLSLYRGMVLTRVFDLKAVSLQRTGRLGTYAVSLGQEGVSVGVASAMRTEDVLLPSYRDNGALLWRGMKMEEVLLFWGGDERGNLSSGRRTTFPTASRSAPRRRTPRASPMHSNSGRNRASRCVSSATAPPRKAMCGKP